MSNNARVVMYATAMCPYCMAARMLFKKKGIEFDELSVSNNQALRDEMESRSGQRTVPQVFIDGQPVGGFDEIQALDNQGELDRLLGHA